ncbi:hypothetical protein M9Y10_033446 [Tritrichomonas musculus]|uniref:Uncharacterized protein n=1 Tax=Tritrichomonas musculus TaxID=1915356 RepID=A0ABR2KC58_9EUKA
MNVESSRKSYFDRQIQSFQFKIQQKLTLWDEEIERLSNRLNMTKSQIHYEKQRIEQLDREISNAIEYKDGEARQKTASFNAIIARAKANYHAQLQSMQTQHMEEITQLQNDFEMQLKRFPKMNDTNASSSIKSVEDEIEKYKQKIDSYKTQTIKIQQENAKYEAELSNGPDGTIDGESLAIDFAPIEKLQNTIQQRQEERFANLKQSKEKLAQCIDILETMTKDHTRNVNEKQQKIHEIEEDYNRKLGNIEEKHQTCMKGLKIQLLEAEKRTRALLRAAKHLGSTNQKQMLETIHELDVMKEKTLEITDNEVLEGDEKSQRQQLKKEINKLKRVLKHRDDDLLQLQEDNQELKREIWRLRHEIKYVNSLSKLPNYDT